MNDALSNHDWGAIQALVGGWYCVVCLIFFSIGYLCFLRDCLIRGLGILLLGSAMMLASGAFDFLSWFVLSRGGGSVSRLEDPLTWKLIELSANVCKLLSYFGMALIIYSIYPLRQGIRSCPRRLDT
jgi:hypothetical protein